MCKVTRPFCWHQNFVPWGLSTPALGLYTCTKSWKKLNEIGLQRDFCETCNKWTKWHQNLSRGCLSMTCGYMHLLNHEKMCIKSEVEEILFELATNDHSGRGARWLSGRVSDSRARGRGFETYRRRVVSLSKTLYSPKVLVNYPGSGGSVPIWLKIC